MFVRDDKQSIETDVCLVLEGTYPYVFGGVSSWAHELIKAQSHLTFSLITLLPPGDNPLQKYELPPNVLEVKKVFLQDLPNGKKRLKSGKKKFFKNISEPMMNIIKGLSLEQFEVIVRAFEANKEELGAEILLNSKDSWDLLLEMYNDMLSSSPFLDYFWSWRNLFGSFYSVLLADFPKAKCYHSLCTGYAGLLATRLSILQNKPLLLTEHGIYTNERRIEIVASDWLETNKGFSLNIKKRKNVRELKDFWTDSFSCYSKLCYNAADKILTLFEANRQLQLLEGAPEGKTDIVPNGIDYDRFSKIKKVQHQNPTVALIGRVVPIKDVKNFIMACRILLHAIPNLKAYIMGPTDEDEDYYEGCKLMVQQEGVESIIEFTGKVNIDDYLPYIDVVALTSISEAQPLVILEAGAAGIPTVATNVGACDEMINGRSGVYKPGGVVVPLANPQATANAMTRLLIDAEFYNLCSKNIKERVRRDYSKVDMNSKYSKIYDDLIKKVGV